MDKLERAKRIHTKYKIYRGDMKNIWEEYSYLVHYIYNAKKEEFELKSLNANQKNIKTKVHAGGMQNRFKSGVNTRNHFVDAIGLFENYIASLARFVYLDYPSKMNGGGMDEKKLFNLIIKSEDKQEMIDNLIEEKIRNIFYGNPVDVFEKDKCKFELGNNFTVQYQDAIVLYREMVGRRNVIIHNSGRVDKKYLRENKDSSFIEGQKITISEEYLRGSIGLLIGIAAIVTKCVVENIYKEESQGILAKAEYSFNRCINIEWYKDLMT